MFPGNYNAWEYTKSVLLRGGDQSLIRQFLEVVSKKNEIPVEEKPRKI